MRTESCPKSTMHYIITYTHDTTIMILSHPHKYYTYIVRTGTMEYECHRMTCYHMYAEPCK